MPKATPTRRRKRKSWTAAEVKLLRQGAGKKTARALGKALKRTEASIRQKALAIGVRFRGK